MFAPWRSQNPVRKTWASDYWKIIHWKYRSALTECELKRFSGAFRAGAPSPLACLPRARPFSLSPDTSKRLLRRLNALRLGSEVCNWYRLAISPIWRRRSTNVQKSLQSLFCILHPACVLLLVCSLHFTLSLHFTPGPQSAVCSPQSAFYTDRLLYWHYWHIVLRLLFCSKLRLLGLQKLTGFNIIQLFHRPSE